MFYALAKDLIDPRGYAFERILQDIRPSRRATRGELDISAISMPYLRLCDDQYALLPSGAIWATDTARCWWLKNIVRKKSPERLPCPVK